MGLLARSLFPVLSHPENAQQRSRRSVPHDRLHELVVDEDAMLLVPVRAFQAQLILRINKSSVAKFLTTFQATQPISEFGTGNLRTGKKVEMPHLHLRKLVEMQQTQLLSQIQLLSDELVALAEQEADVVQRRHLENKKNIFLNLSACEKAFSRLPNIEPNI